MNKLLLGMLLLLSLVMVNSVMGAENDIVVVLPATNAVITGTYNFTVTAGEDNRISNITWLLNNVPIGSDTNSTGPNQTTFSLSYDTTGTTEALDYTLNVTVYENVSSAFSSDSTHTGIDVDNTPPAVSLSLYHEWIRKGENMQTATCTISDAIDSSMLITQTLTKPDGSTVTDTQTDSSKAWIISKSDTLMVDVSDGYEVNCSTIDDAGFTNSTTSTFSVLSETQKPEDITAKEAKKLNIRNLWWIGLILLIVVIAILMIYLTTQDKKKKRK